MKSKIEATVGTNDSSVTRSRVTRVTTNVATPCKAKQALALGHAAQ